MNALHANSAPTAPQDDEVITLRLDDTLRQARAAIRATADAVLEVRPEMAQ
ncbi:hypothetical protein ACIQGO_04550 [Streptomyces shenzhenensis]|uniref:hypothetical protein n=1 Tax=Streptomyces shenzhenensis TaxID=943815 RepID=UPI0037F3FCC8